jgi:hypothetical protein
MRLMNHRRAGPDAAGFHEPMIAGGESPAVEALSLDELLRDEIEQDLAACNAYVDEHGSFSEMVRAHFGWGDAGHLRR